MSEVENREVVSVECYSGARYAERPVALTWRGERLSVESVERAWQTPDGPAFAVRVADGRHFELSYHAFLDQWSVRVSPSSPELSSEKLGETLGREPNS
jgi:hypothetical protein